MTRREAERHEQEAERVALLSAHAARPVDAVTAWPFGRRCPAAGLRDAWVAHRHGLDAVAQGGTVAAGGRSATVARLLILARQMGAIALERDPARPGRQAAWARRRAASDPTRVAFRASSRRWDSSEQRRRRVRDLVRLAGGDPARWPNAELALARHSPDSPELTEPDRFHALDGVGARADRYRRSHEGDPRSCV